MDRAVARAVGTTQQDAAAPLLCLGYTPDELEVLDDEPADPDRLRPVRDTLRDLAADLAAAEAASAHDDWAAMLQAVRLNQGRAVVARRLLEHMLGRDAGSFEPPFVRMVREIGGLIADREIDSLPPDELRARMRGVLQALDRELKAMLSPPDGPSFRQNRAGHQGARHSPRPPEQRDHGSGS